MLNYTHSQKPGITSQLFTRHVPSMARLRTHIISALPCNMVPHMDQCSLNPDSATCPQGQTWAQALRRILSPDRTLGLTQMNEAAGQLQVLLPSRGPLRKPKATPIQDMRLLHQSRLLVGTRAGTVLIVCMDLQGRPQAMISGLVSADRGAVTITNGS